MHYLQDDAYCVSSWCFLYVDHLLGVENCRESMHGCCPDGLTAAEGPNFVGCASSDQIPTGLCIESEFGCCIDGVTPAAGPFNEACHIPTCQVKYEGCRDSSGLRAINEVSQNTCKWHSASD